MNKRTHSHEEIFDILINGILYEKFWKGDMFRKIFYIVFPFLLITCFALILYFRGALVMTEGYSFLNDYSNCYMLCYIFFFMYFVHGMFLPYYDTNIDNLGQKINETEYERRRKQLQMTKIIIFIISLILSIFAIPFMFVANKTGSLNWHSKLENIELLYYPILIVFIWIISAKLFIFISAYSIFTYKYLNNKIDFDLYDSDKKCGLKGLFNSLSASMGFGIYFIIAVGMILYSDYNAYTKYGLVLLAYQYNWIIIAITVILSSIYYSILIITYISLTNTINKAVADELKNGENLSKEKIEFLKSLPTSPIHVHDICVFALSVLFPGIAAIVQIVWPLG